MPQPTFFTDESARTSRELENTIASFVNGMNEGGSCAPGIGINMAGGAVVGSPEQFTLLDQDGDVREPQVGQSLGGVPFVDRSSVPYDSSGGVEGKGTDPIRTGTLATQAAKDSAPALDGVVTVTGNANLETLANGWVDTPVVP